MRLIALAFALVLALGFAQAYPLSGGTAAVNCTLFGVTKVPVPGTDPNATVQNYVLKVDVGLLGTRNATFELVDSKDKVYSPDPSMSLTFQPISESYIRQLLAFVVPSDALFKLFKVTPSVGDPFAIKWWKTPKKNQGDIILRYYGVVNTRTNPNEQSVTYEVGIQNNGTNSMTINPLNFTLLDQSGWEYYTLYGFGQIYLGPKNSTKVNVNFSSLSYLSKPAALAFDYLTSNQIVFDLDKDTGPLTDAQVYGTNVPSTATTPTSTVAPPAAVVAAPVVQAAPQAVPQVAPLTNLAGTSPAAFQSTSGSMQSFKDQLNATKERNANMGRSGTSGSVGGQISQSVNDTKARLEKMKEGLPHGQNATQSTGTPGSLPIA
jgi:hypothetical protein